MICQEIKFIMKFLKFNKIIITQDHRIVVKGILIVVYCYLLASQGICAD